MQGLSGYLLASTLGAPIEREMLTFESSDLGPPSLSFVSSMYRLRQWDELELVSPIALSDEGEAGGPGPFRYRVIAVRGFSKIVLLAERRRVVDYVLNHVFDRQVTPRLRKVSLRLDDAIRFCQSPDSPYLITSMLGRFAGAARQLRAIALYGDDVTDSPIFRDYGHLFNVYSCGLGRRLDEGMPALTANYEGEIVRIGNDGFVLAHLGSRTKARDFMNVIRFVIDHRWVEDWVPVATHAGGDAFG